jgi:sugar phosphate permease
MLMEMNRWQKVTMVSLLCGYGGLYFCRSNLGAAGTLLIEDPNLEITLETMGWFQTLGIATYLFGKFTMGPVCDFFGGRHVFVLAMLASTLATMAFGFVSGVALFAALWAFNRLVQSSGWPALVKVSSNWFDYRIHGTVMGIISLSFLVGDAASRFYFSKLIGAGVGWRGLFFAAAGVLFVLNVAAFFLLKEHPKDVGLPEVEANPDNVFADSKDAPTLAELLGKYLKSFSFWMVLIMSFGLTLVRETLNFWTPILIQQVTGAPAAEAVAGSIVLPLAGGVSVLVAGYLSDKVGGNRAKIILPGLVLAAVALFVLYLVQAAMSYTVLLVCLGLVSFFMIGPYSFLAGAIALDLGGKQGASTASGIIDGVGYGGALLSGVGVGYLAKSMGWGAVFGMLLVSLVVSVFAAALYWWKSGHVEPDASQN